MEALGIFLVFCLMIGILIVIRLFLGPLDKGRIAEHIHAQGGRLVQSSWEPFGPGWFGSKNERIYAVHYCDGEGNEHRSYCKTSVLSGVYFTQDTVVQYARRSPVVSQESLVEENRRLKARIAALDKDQRLS
jgi:hypothetical protein